MNESLENFMFSNLETTIAIVHKYSDIIGQPFNEIAEKLKKHLEDKENDTIIFDVDEDDCSGHDPLHSDTIYVYVKPGNGSKKPSWYIRFKNGVNFLLQIEIFNLNPYGYYIEQPPSIQLKLFDENESFLNAKIGVKLKDLLRRYIKNLPDIGNDFKKSEKLYLITDQGELPYVNLYTKNIDCNAERFTEEQLEKIFEDTYYLYSKTFDLAAKLKKHFEKTKL